MVDTTSVERASDARSRAATVTRLITVMRRARSMRCARVSVVASDHVGFSPAGFLPVGFSPVTCSLVAAAYMAALPRMGARVAPSTIARGHMVIPSNAGRDEAVCSASAGVLTLMGADSMYRPGRGALSVRSGSGENLTGEVFANGVAAFLAGAVADPSSGMVADLANRVVSASVSGAVSDRVRVVVSDPADAAASYLANATVVRHRDPAMPTSSCTWRCREWGRLSHDPHSHVCRSARLRLTRGARRLQRQAAGLGSYSTARLRSRSATRFSPRPTIVTTSNIHT